MKWKAREGGRCQSDFSSTLRLTLIDISYVNRKLNAGFHSTDSGQSNAAILFQVQANSSLRKQDLRPKKCGEHVVIICLWKRQCTIIVPAERFYESISVFQASKHVCVHCERWLLLFKKTPCGAKKGRKSHLFGGARYSNRIKVFKRLIRQSWNETQGKVAAVRASFLQPYI